MQLEHMKPLEPFQNYIHDIDWNEHGPICIVFTYEAWESEDCHTIGEIFWTRHGIHYGFHVPMKGE